MTRRILSGIFLLFALGVLGVLLAGALTSGEQLIVRFLTAVIVAALALYVISDLRLQANDEMAATPREATPTRHMSIPDDPPANSTAAFMATVTGRRESAGMPISADEFSSDAEALTGAAAHRARPILAEVDDVDPAADGWDTVALESETDRSDGVNLLDSTSSATILGSESPYEADLDEAALWPFNDSAEPTDTDHEDGLSAVFARHSEQEPSMPSTQTADVEREEPEATATISEAATTPIDDDAEGVEATTSREIKLQPASVEPGATRGSRVVAADYADAPIAPIIDLRSAPSALGVESAIRSGETGVIATLIEQGLLSTEGPITDRDVRTMVYVAFTSSELRKILLAGGTVDGDSAQGPTAPPANIPDTRAL